MELAAATLSHGRVRLEPFVAAHRDGLIAAAEADAETFRHMPFPVARLGYGAWFNWLRAEQDAGRWIPHAVFLDDRIVGQTCYLNLRAQDASVEIGGTWYAPTGRGNVVNPSCKYLLMRHAFKSGAVRVELKTDALNARSRAAILKLGATFEGVHRKQLRRPDGTWRDTAWYSVLDEEWAGVKAGLEARLAGMG